MIEKLIESLIASLDANTEALKAGVSGQGQTTSAPAATEKSTKTEKADKTETKKKSDEPKITQDQVNAALVKIKDDFGMDEAKKIISEVGKVSKMGEIKPAQYQAVFDAAVARHAELSGGGEDDGL